MAKIVKNKDIEKISQIEEIDKVSYSKRFYGNLFSLILLLLLMISMIRVLLESEFSVSLGGFLEYLVNVPDVSLSWLRGIDLTIYADWGVFEFFRTFLNSLTGILEVALMLVGGIIQLLTYVAYIIAYIFL